MKFLIPSIAIIGLLFCMSDAAMPWSNLIGMVLIVICYFLLKWKGEEL